MLFAKVQLSVERASKIEIQVTSGYPQKGEQRKYLLVKLQDLECIANLQSHWNGITLSLKQRLATCHVASHLDAMSAKDL